MADDVRFWNRVARRYARMPMRDEAIYLDKLARTRAHLRPDMRLLDLGSGTGTTALNHAPYVHEVLGVDLSPQMTAIARERAVAQGVLNARFETASVATALTQPQTFDMILALNLLHLLPDWRTALPRIRQRLVPGGLFASSTLCLGEGWHPLKPLIAVLGPVGLLPRLRFLSETALLAGLQDAGFTVIDRLQPGPRKALFLIARADG